MFNTITHGILEQTSGQEPWPVGPLNIGAGFDATVMVINAQTDHKILVGGHFTTYKGSTQNRLIRLNADGSKDTSFDIGTGFNAGVITIIIQPDGKILAGGEFTTYKGSTQNRLIRLNADGSKDTSFDIGTGFNDKVINIALLSSGKILVAGKYTEYKGSAQNRLIQLNSNGSKDTSFDIGTGFNGDVQSLQIQSNGKILATGDYITFNGGSQKRLIRLNSDGSKDISFDIGGGFNGYVENIILDQDEKIIAGGGFAVYNTVSARSLVRINTNGDIDTTFNIGSGLEDVVVYSAIQENGKIITGGEFTKYNGNAQNRLIRLNADGSKDASFDIGTGFNNYVEAIYIQSNGKILIGGGFNTYKGNTRNNIVRLNPDGSDDTITS